jgi:hypothetical protein
VQLDAPAPEHVSHELSHREHSPVLGSRKVEPVHIGVVVVVAVAVVVDVVVVVAVVIEAVVLAVVVDVVVVAAVVVEAVVLSVFAWTQFDPSCVNPSGHGRDADDGAEPEDIHMNMTPTMAMHTTTTTLTCKI